MAIYKATAEGDTMYIQADSQESAQRKLRLVCGPIPDSMIDWQEVYSLPEGEELMADPEDRPSPDDYDAQRSEERGYEKP